MISQAFVERNIRSYGISADLDRGSLPNPRQVSRRNTGESAYTRLSGTGVSRSKNFGALLLGAYRNGSLRYFGHSGTGLSEKGLADAIDRLKPLFTDKPTVENPPKIPERIQWVQPKLVCEVAFAEWTQNGKLRQTTFMDGAIKRSIAAGLFSG
jgi:ATP dependent DNA ligase C terminal region